MMLNKAEPDLLNLEPAFLEVAHVEAQRMLQWFYKTPMRVSPERCDEMQQAQQLIYQVIVAFVTHYADYAALLPLTSKAREIVEIASQFAYRVGTYRPDFLISEQNEIKICEINARFPLNGYFNAAVTECIANQLAAEQGLILPQLENRKFLGYLSSYFGVFDRLCVLKSPADRAMDLRLYSQIFEKSGIPCTVIAPDQAAEHGELLRASAVINEFNQMDLETLDHATLETIAASNSLNDLRTIFLVHDKRFMTVLSNRAFLADFLSPDESEFLCQHVIPTYLRSQNGEIWEQARAGKDDWLLKPYLLGKSESLYAGCVTEEPRWQAVFASAEIEQMVLQPFIAQKRFVASLDGRMYQDYVVGTFLCFDDQFFGFGRFRTSSFPVTNQGDDRKVAPLVIPGAGQLATPFVL